MLMMIRPIHFANEYDEDDIGNTNNIEDYVNSALQWRGRLGMHVRSDILRPLCQLCRFFLQVVFHISILILKDCCNTVMLG